MGCVLITTDSSPSFQWDTAQFNTSHGVSNWLLHTVK